MAEFERRDIKKDELNDFVVNAINWVKKNQVLFFSVLGTIAGVVALSVFFFTRYYQLQTRAADRLSVAQGQLYQGDVDKAVGMLDDIIMRYPRTVYGSQARLMKAQHFIGLQNYEEAEKVIKPVTREGKPKTLVPLAFSMLGTIQEDAGKNDDAIATYTQFLQKYPGHFFVPKVYESLARLYELNNQIDDALAAYEKLAALYPGSGWSARAKERIDMISAYKASAGKQEAPSGG